MGQFFSILVLLGVTIAIPFTMDMNLWTVSWMICNVLLIIPILGGEKANEGVIVLIKLLGGFMLIGIFFATAFQRPFDIWSVVGPVFAIVVVLLMWSGKYSDD